MFSLADDGLEHVAPVPFATDHLEEDVQRWADQTPAFVNEGAPMLSLGCEIATPDGLSLDNLFLDGNACVVVAEMKRGRTPRHVTGQLLDYAVFAKDLTRADLERYCHRRHGEALEAAFKRVFGRPLPGQAPSGHRLLVVAPEFDDRTVRHCLYLLESGTPLACIQFTLYEVGTTKLFETNTIVGEIPEQVVGPGSGAIDPMEGRYNWLFSQIAAKVPSLARAQGWEPRITHGKWQLNLSSAAWSDQHWQRAFFLGRRGEEHVLELGFWFHTPAYPDLWTFLESDRPAWAERLGGRVHNAPKSAFLILHQYAPPEPGDEEALARILRDIEEMTAVLVPLLDRYLLAGDRRPATSGSPAARPDRPTDLTRSEGA